MRSRIVTDKNGVSVVSPNGVSESSIRWGEIYAISCYKIDAKTKEIVFLTFDFSWGESIEVATEMSGFLDLLSSLYQHLDVPENACEEGVAALNVGDNPVMLFRKHI